MTDFTSEDVIVERRMLEQGEARFKSRMQQAIAHGRETGMGPQRFLFRRATPKVRDALEAFVEELKAARGKPHLARQILEDIDLAGVAEIACRTVLDQLHTLPTYNRLAFQIGNEVQVALHLAEVKKNDRMLAERIRRDVKHRPSRLPRRLAAIADGYSPGWSAKLRRSVGAVALDCLIQATGLVETVKYQTRAVAIPGHRARAPRTRLMVEPTQATFDWLQEAIARGAEMSPVFAPTDTEPRDWTDVYSGGYKTDLMNRRPFLDVWRRRELREAEHESVRGHLAGVNVLQKTRWAVNQDVLEVARHCWDSGIALPGMPSADPRPLPPRPPKSAGKAARVQWGNERSLAIRLNVADRANRFNALTTLAQAQAYRERPFYLPWKGDFRGRLYPIPPYLNPQAADLGRSLLRFAEGKLLRREDRGSYLWFANHGASAFGIKGTLTEKAAWVEAHGEVLARLAADPLDETLWMQADEPWQFLAWALEAGELFETGQVINRVPISMDGSNNGLQIYSLLLRDPELARRTSCTEAPVPADVYQDVADLLTARLVAETENIDLKDPADAVLAQQWLDFMGGRVDRDLTKKPVMTLPYSSTLHACGEGIVDWFEQRIDAGAEKPPFYSNRGKDDYWKPCGWLAVRLWAAVQDLVPAAVACMDWLQECARILADQNLTPRWTTPTGWRVLQSKPLSRATKVRTRTPLGTRSSRVYEETKRQGKGKNASAIAPNFVHSLDASALVRTVLLAHAEGVESFAMIHDSFATHATDTVALARCLRQAYGKMFSEANLLEILRRDLERDLPPHVTLPAPPNLGSFDPMEVTRALYFFS